ncbi:hypothetical protein F511_26899 [Dorcoceras hygrometricum]|uniref:Uncharacterized protein n=1 Tax=Dorcoceras hygrometricum TaxID=472368 RepID=A0A2Z7BXV6_9LAMI|nr:hypothetical protein F511_26899 [Dorcoceras hygrometricum]
MVSAGSKQAKGFSVQISLLLESIPNLELGESTEFPSSKILTDKTVPRYISFNDKVGVEEAADAPPMNKAPRKPAVSTKRPAIATTEEPVPKKKRTSKKKSGSSSSPLEIVVVAQESVPLQMVEPFTGVPTAEEPAEQPAAEKISLLINQLTRDKPADTIEERQWFHLSHEELIAKWAAERLVTTPNDTDEEIEAERPIFDLFSWLPTADITDFLSSIALDRTAFRSVQIAQNTVSVAPSVQILDEPSSSESSSGGDAKKGEGSSSLPQPPPSDVQNLESGQFISLEETAERIREADRRQAEAEREKERQRRIRRLSGSSKRRRY